MKNPIDKLEETFLGADKRPLDPGIKRVVAALRARGFITTDSGDGVSKSGELLGRGCAEPYPHVFMVVSASALVEEADRLLMVVRGGLFTEESVAELSADPFDVEQVRAIEATYSPVDGVCALALIGFGDADLREELPS